MTSRPGTRPRRDCVCPRSHHEHGTRDAYNRDHCRCAPCTRASSAYARSIYKRQHLQRSGIAPTTHCDPIGARRRLQALAVMGWSTREIGAQMGVTGEAVEFLRRSHHRMFRQTAADVAAVYDRLSMIVPDWHRYRTRTRNAALARGWLPPLAWDDDTIDDPTAEPLPIGQVPPSVGLDEIAVDRIMAGTLPAPRRFTPEWLEAIRILTGRGMTDSDIGARIGVQAARVCQARLRNGIPAANGVAA